MLRTKRQAGREYSVAFERDGETTFARLYSANSVTVYAQPSFSGAMRKHANFKHDRKDRDLSKLDAVASVKSHVWGVLRRRGNTLAIVG